MDRKYFSLVDYVLKQVTPGSQKNIRWLLVPGCLLIAWLVSFPAFCSDNIKRDEIELRADYLINIAKLVNKPQANNGSVSEHYRFCILGKDEALYKTLKTRRNQEIHQRKIDVLNYFSPVYAASCDAVYIALSEARVIDEIIAELKTLPILTISSIPGFIAAKGMFELSELDGHLVFLAHHACAKQSQLHIHSGLLTLAVNRSEFPMDCQ